MSKGIPVCLCWDAGLDFVWVVNGPVVRAVKSSCDSVAGSAGRMFWRVRYGLSDGSGLAVVVIKIKAGSLSARTRLIFPMPTLQTEVVELGNPSDV